MIRKANISGEDIIFTQYLLTGATANIFRSNCGSFIMKVVDKNLQWWEHADCYSREKHILRHIKSHGFNWVPEILITCDEERYIVMTYCGETLNKDNAPSDTKEQLYTILNSLETLNVAHNDINTSNVLVKDDKIYLCDWGWSAINNSLTCDGRFADIPDFNRNRKTDKEMVADILTELSGMYKNDPNNMTLGIDAEWVPMNTKAVTSSIWSSKCNKYVVKLIGRINDDLFNKYNLYEREAFVLDRMEKLGIEGVPKLISKNDSERAIVMTNCGVPLTTKNAPDNTRAQLIKLITEISSHSIQHNDLGEGLSKGQILVKDNIVYICDWGWASLHGNFDWGMGFMNENITEFLRYNQGRYALPDKHAIENIIRTELHKDTAQIVYNNMLTGDASNSWKKYMDGGRNNVGSQSERSNVILEHQMCRFEGYQNFVITKDSVTPLSKQRKYMALADSLKRIGIHGKTVADIGANNGIVAYMARALGAATSYAYDHDKECIANITAANNHLNITNLHAIDFDFGDMSKQINADIVIAMALIHWVYSCTSSFGCLNKIVARLCSMTSKFLIIEWIAPDDAAIKLFHHTDFNPDITKQPYTTENFEKAISNNGCVIIEKLPTESSTRTTYVITR